MRSTLLLIGLSLSGCSASAAWIPMADWNSMSLPIVTALSAAGAVAIVRMGEICAFPDVDGASVAQVRRLALIHMRTLDALALLMYAAFATAACVIALKAAGSREWPAWVDATVSGLLGLACAYVAVRTVQMHRVQLAIRVTHRRMTAKDGHRIADASEVGVAGATGR